jgi:hypothetical protein
MLEPSVLAPVQLVPLVIKPWHLPPAMLDPKLQAGSLAIMYFPEVEVLTQEESVTLVGLREAASATLR